MAPAAAAASPVLSVLPSSVDENDLHARKRLGRGDGRGHPVLFVLGRDDARDAGEGGTHPAKVNPDSRRRLQSFPDPCSFRRGAGSAEADKVAAVSGETAEVGVDATLGVRNEVGRLRTVMLHRPGNELRRLTPRNNDALLFDGLPWVDRAQEEHDAFADALRNRGVEVLYLSRLLIETLADTEARAQAIEHTLTDIRLGDALRTFLRSLPGAAGLRRPGRGHHDRAAQRRGTRHRQPGRRAAAARRLPDRPAAQPAVHPRLQCLGPGPGDDHLAGHAGPPAGDPADRADL